MNMKKWYIWNRSKEYFQRVYRDVEDGKTNLIESKTPIGAIKRYSYTENISDDDIMDGDWWVVECSQDVKDYCEGKRTMFESDEFAESIGFHFLPIFVFAGFEESKE